MWVPSQPEERVRQSWLTHLIQNLHFPIGGFAIEKGLNQMPHIAQQAMSLPQRRADLIFFAQNIHPLYELYPLLLIECKAIPLNEKVIRQTAGYNYYVQAPFFAVVNQNEGKTYWYDKETNQLQSTQNIPSYENLMKYAQINKK